MAEPPVPPPVPQPPVPQPAGQLVDLRVVATLLALLLGFLAVAGWRVAAQTRQVRVNDDTYWTQS